MNMKTLLVSLVSDQTIPNVQLINELKDNKTEYLFITTKKMEEKGCRQWIEKATGIKSVLNPIIVNEYSYDDIKHKLNEFDVSLYGKIIVNLTGGTKVMTIAAHDFFKEEGADIYYVTGVDKKIIKIFPGKKKLESIIMNSLSVEEYLIAYGFTVQKNDSKHVEDKITRKFFNMFCNKEIYNYVTVINKLRAYRNKGLKENSFDKDIAIFLQSLDFKSDKPSCLSADEIKYLTGEWFEQYVYNEIKKDFHLDDTKILMGVKLNKEIKDIETNILKQLLQTEDVQSALPKNEIDVIFMYNGRIYVIECKTSIVDIKENKLGQNGEKIIKSNEINFLGETIYKADSINNKFGLFAKSFIFTMTDFKEYIYSEDIGEAKNKKRKMEELINRASMAKISIADRNILTKSKSIKDIILSQC